MSRTSQKVALRFITALAMLAALFTGTTAGVSLARTQMLQTDVGQITISCTFFNDTDISYSVSLEQRPSGTPTGTVTITLVDGTTQTQSFTGNSFTIRGAYAKIRVEATWPDGTRGFAEATCGQVNPTQVPAPTRTPRPTITPGGPTLTPRPTRTPGPTRTPRPTNTPGPQPTSAVNGSISIVCEYFSNEDRRFTVRLQQRPGGAPSGTATLTLLGGGTEDRAFTSNDLVYRGPYVAISVSATWPDGASGFAAATCGQDTPSTPTLPPATPTEVESATSTPPPPPPPTGTTPPPPTETTPPATGTIPPETETPVSGLTPTATPVCEEGGGGGGGGGGEQCTPTPTPTCEEGGGGGGGGTGGEQCTPTPTPTCEEGGSGGSGGGTGGEQCTPTPTPTCEEGGSGGSGGGGTGGEQCAPTPTPTCEELANGAGGSGSGGGTGTGADREDCQQQDVAGASDEDEQAPPRPRTLLPETALDDSFVYGLLTLALLLVALGAQIRLRQIGGRQDS